MTGQSDRLGTSPGIGCKGPCVVASTANLTLNAPQTIDTVAVVAGDRVLVKDQTAGEEDGIYIVRAGDWDRASDWDASGEIRSGLLVPVASGTAGTGLHQITFAGAYALGTTSITATKLA